MTRNQEFDKRRDQASEAGASNGRNSPASPLSSAEILGSDFAAAIDTAFQSSEYGVGQGDGNIGKMFIRHDSSRTPTSQSPSSAQTPVALEEVRARSRSRNSSRGCYFSLQPLQGSNAASIANSTAASNVSSPLQSAYASSSSLQSSHAGQQNDGPPEKRPSVNRDISLASTQATLGPPLDFDAPPPTSAPIDSKQATTRRLREGPIYPNQSFAALQYQYHPPPHQPHPLRTRSSHASPDKIYSSNSSRNSQDRSSMASGARTVGHTPSQSPGLYSPTTSRHRDEGKYPEEARYSTPLLHPSHLQAPKETHKLLKDVDPISGRKLVNNYEFVKKLGSGTHGTVKLARDLETNEYVAIKIVRRFSKKIRLGKHETPEDKVKKEVAVLKKARHPHVVSLLEVIDDQEFGKVYLILEYVELGEIVWRTQTDKAIAIFEMNRVKREIFGKVNEGLEYQELIQFNENAPTRRIEKERVLAEQRRQVTERLSISDKTSTGITEQRPDGSRTPFWSLEYGGESEDEHNVAKLSDITDYHTRRELTPGEHPSQPYQSASVSHGHPSRSSTPVHRNPPKQPLDTSDAEQHMASGHSIESHPLLPASALEGTMWGAYCVEDLISQDTDSVFQSTLDQVINEQTQWTEEEEEFMYVPCLTMSQALEAFRDTVLGLEYLHYQGIIHRDIKPANLLWTADHRVKISDFGVSYLGKPIREDENKEEIPEADAANLDEAIELAKTVGTPAFYAPELCNPALYDSERNPDRPQITGQIDVWALGVTLYGMIFGRLPFFDVNEFKMYEKIAGQEVFIPQNRLRGVEDHSEMPMNSNKRLADILEYEEVDDELRDLLKRLLHKQPSKRITLREVKHHPWVLRGIKDHTAWIDETDPSLQSQGKKIEVSSQEVDDAVVGLTLFGRVKSSIRRLGSVVRGRDSRKRAGSNAKGSEGSTALSPKVTESTKEGRSGSLRADEQISSALRASRETSEHPLSQSVAASPEIMEDGSYFDKTRAIVTDAVLHSPSLYTKRPSPPERAISTAESMKTIRASVPIITTQNSPPPLEGHSQTTTVFDPSASSGLSGIFGGAGRRFVKSMRSRERGYGRDSASQSSRSSSVENIASAIEDPHASPSIGFSSATAAGHVDQPPVLREEPPREVTSQPASPHHQRQSYVLGKSSGEAFQRTQEQNYHCLMPETEHATRCSPRSSVITSTFVCPPSPDDELFFAEQEQRRSPSQDAVLPISSSSDQMASGMSESFSYPSIPSVVSGASSLSAAATEEQMKDSFGVVMPTVIGSAERLANVREIGKASLVDDDEAGYNGDGDEEEESDDEGIVFGGK